MAQNSFEQALCSAHISDAVRIESVRLSRENHQLTVSLHTENPLSQTQRDALSDALAAILPGVSIRLECADDAAAAVLTVPPLSPAAPVTVTAPAPATASPDGTRVLFGSSIKTASRTEIHALCEGDATVVIQGTLVSAEMREGWKGRDGRSSFRVQLNLTDLTDSIYCICTFYEEAKAQRFFDWISPFIGAKEELVVRGVCRMPKYAKELNLFVNDVNSAPAVFREDKCEEKRVELHLHSRMSTMDGLTDVTEAFKTAKRWGHRALAITDHGVVQAFPEAAKASKKTGVKAIFGVEGYLVPDTDLIDMQETYVVFDIETTGLKAQHADIIEIGAVKIENGRIIDRFQTFVNGGVLIPPNITKLTGITNAMIADAPSARDVLEQFSLFVKGCCLVAHNANFDVRFIRYHGGKYQIAFDEPYADTLMLSRYLLHDLPNHKLDTVCEHFQVDLTNHHRAIDDAAATAEVFLHLIALMQQLGVQTIPVQRPAKAQEREQGKHKHKTNHIILLATTQVGMKNLYRLVSYAHLDYFRSRPTIPRSLLSVYRSGLLLGSACEQGELYQAILKDKPADEIERIASMYDFLEIQPLGNNAFMVREGIVPDDEALREINRRIVRLGHKLGLPVVATGDVHFLEPPDAEYRKLLMMKLGFSDAAEQAPLYFKTTDEMLDEFSYLGEEDAHAVVIDGPNSIADRCEALKPFPDGTHAPEIPNASNELRDMATREAHSIYGDPLPDVVQARLDRELKSIIGNGFASLYLMAQRLVHKSNSDGYLVGSRGSVGSSFVATMAGITEVNALQPHYVCPNCKHSDFDVDRSVYACGVDMPDKDCPVCGARYKKQGFGIPFEVFLGFKGDKTPDIDLNFSGEYQPVAHKYVEEMFGVGHAFRAGTISGLAEKKAYECIYHYMETTGTVLRRAEMERLCKGCLNVKVTTGQHPGGIVIVPKDDDILDYTPIQYPADKKDKNTITTHFDFHAMDDRLVKLDILGHDDPTALRMLEDITGINPRSIPLDDPETMRIFTSPEPLGIDLSGLSCTVGSLGIPEFGTGFVRTVLENTQPKTMEELVRIAGLTHGTDVWLNNAEPLVMNGIAKLSEVLCTRDDIMNYLIAHDMEASLSFSIMERVRKGRGLTEEMEQAMVDGKIPAWFIDSCKKIKYMFPRGHAVAYVMMAFRIAYFKVHYPEAFYAVYYTVRADAFDVSMASGDAPALLRVIQELDKNAQFKEAAERKRDKELITILEVVYEMNLRGIRLLPVDIYKSHATKFLIEPEGIRPPFNAIAGVGDNAAISMAENRGTAPFLSIEDFQARTGANSGVITAMENCGCFAGLPKSNQISLF